MNFRFVASIVARWFLPIWFTAFAIRTYIAFASADHLGIDVEIYRHAAEVALAGGNPWTTEPGRVPFVAPPPTLLPYVPLTLIPLGVATVAFIGTCLGAAVWAIRRLGLPLWWILFPPLFDALIVGNPDALVLPLLVARGPVSGLAIVFKVYAAVPLIIQRRWVPLIVGAGVSALALPQAANFLSEADTIAAAMTNHAKLSAWGTVFAIPVIGALWYLRHNGAEWLIVPALWPNSQTQYGAMALPAVHRYPVGAALIGLNTPLLPPLAVVVMAVEEWLRRRAEARVSFAGYGDGMGPSAR